MTRSFRPHRNFAVAVFAAALAGCGEPEPEPPAPAPIADTVVTPSPESAAPADPDAERLERMATRYAKLDAYRSATRTRYNDIAFRTGRAKPGAERARRIVGLLDRAGYHLQVPKGPAAFSNPEEIDREVAVFDAVNGMLDEAEAELQAAASAAP